MKLPHSVCEVLREHVVLESECIDRMYLNVYVPQLQRIGGVVWYLRGHLGQRFASTAGVAPKTDAFVADIERFVAEQGVEMVSFTKHQRKDDVTQQYLRQFDADEGVLYVGRAQEKARVVRTERRRNPATGMSYPWVVDGSAMVNHFYFYCVDADFGPFFLKFCSYFPYNAKLCINGNEYAKCQLRKRGIAFEALDNGVLYCSDPKALQRICDGLDDKKIDRLLRKWLARLPHPFDRRDRMAGECTPVVGSVNGKLAPSWPLSNGWVAGLRRGGFYTPHARFHVGGAAWPSEDIQWAVLVISKMASQITRTAH